MALAALPSLISAISQSVTHLVSIRQRQRERAPISMLWHRYTVNSSVPSPPEVLVARCCTQALVRLVTTPLLPDFITRGTTRSAVVDVGFFLAVLRGKAPPR